MRRMQAFLALFFVILFSSQAFSKNRKLNIEVRGTREPYSMSVVISGSEAHYAVRNELSGTVSKFTVPDETYAVVEVYFFGGYVLAQTINLKLTPGDEPVKVVLDRDRAISATDLVTRSNSVSVSSLASEAEQEEFIRDFEAQMEMGNARKAEKILWKLLDKQPDNVVAWNNLGALRLAKGDYDTAADYLKQALRGTETLFEAQLNLSRIYLQRGDIKAALQHARKANRIRENHPSALSQQATILMQEKRYIKVKPLLEKLIEVDPYHTTYPDLGLAIAYNNLGDYREAARCVREWALKHPTHEEAAALRAQAEQGLQLDAIEVARAEKLSSE